MSEFNRELFEKKVSVAFKKTKVFDSKKVHNFQIVEFLLENGISLERKNRELFWVYQGQKLIFKESDFDFFLKLFEANGKKNFSKNVFFDGLFNRKIFKNDGSVSTDKMLESDRKFFECFSEALGKTKKFETLLEMFGITFVIKENQIFLSHKDFYFKVDEFVENSFLYIFDCNHMKLTKKEFWKVVKKFCEQNKNV